MSVRHISSRIACRSVCFTYLLRPSVALLRTGGECPANATRMQPNWKSLRELSVARGGISLPRVPLRHMLV
jgi:hypothetical protein